MNDCFTEIRYTLESGSFASWSVNDAAGFTADEISPSEIWIHHNAGFLPVGDQTPLLFTLAPDVNTNMLVAYLDDCAQIGCEIFGGIPIESCPDPQDASIVGVKYRECNSLPYSNQQTIPDWTIQLLDEMGNVLGEQVTDADGAYAFYDLHAGNYIIREGQLPGWTTKVPASGEYSVNLAASEQAERNFGNCPGCSCDSIYMNVVQLPGTSDTCAYVLELNNNTEFCFEYMDVTLNSGIIVDFFVENGFVEVIDSQNVRFLAWGAACACHYRITGSSSHEISVSTSYNTGNGDVTCSRDFSYSCPSSPVPPPCCPAGYQFGPELVNNGDFELGNQGFTNTYGYFIPGGPTSIGKYSVLNQSEVYTANNQWTCLDHTAFSATGKMLIVDGYGGAVAWEQTVNVLAGKSYSFSAWFNNLVIPTKNYDDPQMALFVDNNMIAGPLNLPETPDEWVRLCEQWTSMTTGPVTLSIRMLSTADIGNDVGIDDVSLRECIPPPPCQVSISYTQNSDCTITVSATTTGPQPVTYQWCDGRTDDSFTIFQTPCTTVTYCVTATCADGSTSTAALPVTVSDPTPPVALCNPGIGVVLDANCTYTVTTAFVDGGSTDNCGIQSMSVSPTLLVGCIDTNVVLTVTDWCNNTSTCTMGIQTIESVPPVITCPINISIQGSIGPNGQCTAPFIPPTVSATDNCDPNVMVTNNAPTVLSEGPNTITYTATDDCGNQSTCSYVVTVYCDSCTCGTYSDLNYRPTQGAPNISISCGDTLMAACKGPIPWTLNGNFSCSGGVCPDTTQMMWMLTKPDGSMTGNSMFADPGFNVSIMASEFNMPGCYGLSLKAICGMDTCYCDFKILVEDCPCIEDFEDGSTGQWQTLNGAISNFFDPVLGSNVLKGDDFSGPSWMYNNSSAYSGDWTQNFNNCFCFSIRYDSGIPSNPASGTSAISIYQGATPSVATKRAVFLVNTPIGNTWTRVCAPVALATGSTYPSNSYGTWTSTSTADFNSIISSVSGIGVLLDFAGGSSPSEKVYVDDFCIEKCLDSCFCGGFTNLYARDKNGTINQAFSCGDEVNIFSCTAGQGINITGAFNCQGDLCDPEHQIEWTLTGPNNSTHTGNFLDNDPIFGIYLYAAWLSSPGDYTLDMKGNCGGDSCFCSVTFHIDCPEICPCDMSTILDMEKRVNKGFAISKSLNSCNACFYPLAVSDCETVDWHLGSSSTGQLIGSTNGKQSICYTFSTAGTYTITMVVTRLKPGGELCEIFEKSRSVSVSCGVINDCDNTLFANPRFNDMPEAGGLADAGKANGWEAFTGSPLLLEDGNSEDGWSMVLTGSRDASDVLSSAMPFCIPRNDTGVMEITLRAPTDPIPGCDVKVGKKPPGGGIHISFFTGMSNPYPNCEGQNCYVLANLEDIIPFDDNGWYNLSIPYDLGDWDPVNFCGDNNAGISAKLAIYVDNYLSQDQFIASVKDGVVIDDLCIGSKHVGTQNPSLSQSVHVYPNPNNGTFTVVLPSPAKVSTTFRITDISGKTMIERNAEISHIQQQLDLQELPGGLYFLQVVTDGKVLGVEKFVKQ